MAMPRRAPHSLFPRALPEGWAWGYPAVMAPISACVTGSGRRFIAGGPMCRRRTGSLGCFADRAARQRILFATESSVCQPVYRCPFYRSKRARQPCLGHRISIAATGRFWAVIKPPQPVRSADQAVIHPSLSPDGSLPDPRHPRFAWLGYEHWAEAVPQ